MTILPLSGVFGKVRGPAPTPAGRPLPGTARAILSRDGRFPYFAGKTSCARVYWFTRAL